MIQQSVGKHVYLNKLVQCWRVKHNTPCIIIMCSQNNTSQTGMSQMKSHIFHFKSIQQVKAHVCWVTFLGSKQPKYTYFFYKKLRTWVSTESFLKLSDFE